LLLGTELSIALIIPPDRLNLVSGLLDALRIFFWEIHWQHYISLMLLLVFIGNFGSVAAWMLGSTRSMFIAVKTNHVTSFLQKTNHNEAPVGILIIEACLFTLASGAFLIFYHITDSFWLLLDIASQISLIYYVILFFSAIRLCQFQYKKVIVVLMFLGIFTSVCAFLTGFIPPPDLSAQEIIKFHLMMFSGLILTCLIPLLFLLSVRKETEALH
jgi:amino acid transporter